MTTTEAWAILELAMAQRKPNSCVVVSPAALATVLAEHREQQGEEDED
jgi:hypothetical protein